MNIPSAAAETTRGASPVIGYITMMQIVCTAKMASTMMKASTKTVASAVSIASTVTIGPTATVIVEFRQDFGSSGTCFIGMGLDAVCAAALSTSFETTSP